MALWAFEPTMTDSTRPEQKQTMEASEGGCARMGDRRRSQDLVTQSVHVHEGFILALRSISKIARAVKDYEIQKICQLALTWLHHR